MLQKLIRAFKTRDHQFQYLKNHLVDKFQSRGTYGPRQRREYKRILDNYWSPVDRAKRFHLFNEIRVPLIYSTYKPTIALNPEQLRPREDFRNIKMLVVGCGGGIGSEALAELNFDVTGIDPNPDLISIAEDHQKRNKVLRSKTLKYVNVSIEEYSETHAGVFDAVVISDVLEYLTYWNKQPFLEKCIRCCKVDGQIFITTFNCSYQTFLWTLAFATEPNFNAIPLSWTKGTTPDSLHRMLRFCGCSVRDTRGISFNVFENKFILDDERHRWYFVYAVKQALIGSSC